MEVHDTYPDMIMEVAYKYMASNTKYFSTFGPVTTYVSTRNTTG